MTLPRPLVRIGIVFAALWAGVAIVETGWHLASGPQRPDAGRYLLFGSSSGSALRNEGRFFLYQPNATIRVAAYFDTAAGVAREYEYAFATNNLGLVQAADVVPGRPSALILGDSFTEGQGAEPWFAQVAPSLTSSGYQPINGGIMGTGFAQWILLHDHLLERGITIRKLIVVMISDDYEREVWNFSPAVTRCLAHYRDCAGDEEFYGMPPDADRAGLLAKASDYQSRAMERRPLRRWLPATTLAYGEARHLIEQAFRSRQERVRSRRVGFFAERYGTNLIFVHIPTREELRDGIDRSGIAARAAIKASGAAFFDGFAQCGLASADFYQHDGHPNAAGYAKIAACVRKAAQQIL